MTVTKKEIPNFREDFYNGVAKHLRIDRVVILNTPNQICSSLAIEYHRNECMTAMALTNKIEAWKWLKEFNDKTFGGVSERNTHTNEVTKFTDTVAYKHRFNKGGK